MYQRYNTLLYILIDAWRTHLYFEGMPNGIKLSARLENSRDKRVKMTTVCLLSHGAGYFCDGNKSFFESSRVLSAFRLAAARHERRRRGAEDWLKRKNSGLYASAASNAISWPNTLRCSCTRRKKENRELQTLLLRAQDGLLTHWSS